jgi:plastocyanin
VAHGVARLDPVRVGAWAAVVLLASAGCIGTEAPQAQGGAPQGAGEPDASPGPAPSSAGPNANGNASTPAAADGPVVVEVGLTGVYPANPDFSPDPIRVPAQSQVVLTFRNTDMNPLGKHDWTVDGVQNASTHQIEVGKAETIRFVAPKAGTYVFYCSVPSHKDMGVAGGMKGAFIA